MSTINEYFDNIQMAFASYAELYQGISDADYKRALFESGMVKSQFDEFASTYTVLDSQPNTQEGFSATVFKKNGTEEYTLAIRGTEPTFTTIAGDLFRADIADIGGDGIAVSQALDLFNYYQKLTAVKDKAIYQYSLVANPIDPYDILFGGLGWITAKQVGVAKADGILSGKTFNVAGHSLGGQLAMIMGRLDPARVNEVYTYNAPGFDTGIIPGFDNTELFFQRLAQRQTQISGGTTINANDFPTNKLNNFATPLDVVSDIGRIPGGLVEHFGESTTTIPILSQLEAHDKKTISDAFAVYNLLASAHP